MIGNLHPNQRIGNHRNHRRHFLVAAIDWKRASPQSSPAPQRSPVATSWWRLLIGNFYGPVWRITGPFLVATSWWRLLIGNVSRSDHFWVTILRRHFLVAAIDWKQVDADVELTQPGGGRHFLVAAIDWKQQSWLVSSWIFCSVATSWWRLLIGNCAALGRCSC